MTDLEQENLLKQVEKAARHFILPLIFGSDSLNIDSESGGHQNGIRGKLFGHRRDNRGDMDEVADGSNSRGTFFIPGNLPARMDGCHEDVLDFLEPTERSGPWHEKYLVTFYEKNTEIIIIVGVDYRKMLGHSATYRVSKGDYRLVEKKWSK